MHHIELLGADNKDFRIKFISILKYTSIYDTKTLSSFYDDLLNSKKVIIEFRELDNKFLNDIASKLTDLYIRIGGSSFHEDDEFYIEE
ncbi:hypothetical protein IRZ71_04450 [Flavobacterium sp. ANB]|uniref:hypothetical protein n=1 Tax=unclassified Flavobacterium TaxID=196869 RepID=UPI0012B7BB57|nr:MULTISPECIES: hypothetical protein [unclassified Flavobacterium]MBF4515577.1 hypothetical protein [Flavobacterium sp. ANB]MTD68580.1 hypothetical protein [Flavobacterium sp. LC2016-13]